MLDDDVSLVLWKFISRGYDLENMTDDEFLETLREIAQETDKDKYKRRIQNSVDGKIM